MANTYTLIASNTLSSSAASVTFSSIPSTYTDLVLRVSARSSRSFTTETMWLRLNNLSTSIYSNTFVSGSGSAASSNYNSGLTYADSGVMPGSTATSNTFSNTEIYIPNYTGTSKKTFSIHAVQENNTTAAFMYAFAELADVTSAITQIDLLSASNNFVSGSSFFLYGIKNS